MFNDCKYDLDVFGAVHHHNKIYGYRCWTDEEIETDDIVVITNSNCEFEFDNKTGVFENNLLYCFICDLEIIKTDFSEYVPEQSNNGGKYAYAECKVLQVKEKTY